MPDTQETISTNIWLEESAPDNPFAADTCYCSGYDVYGDLLGKVSWVEYVYLLFRLELPSAEQARMLETVTVAIANPGIRDHSVRAAMNAGVGGSTRASALIAALAVGAGNLGGGREVVQMIRWWRRLDTDLQRWLDSIHSPPEEEVEDTWQPMEHVPGFDPHGVSCAGPVLRTLAALRQCGEGRRLQWLDTHRAALEGEAGYPLAMAGVIATALLDLGFDEAQAEMLYLLLRLPGAAAHALEQEQQGWRNYPFFGAGLTPMKDDEYWDLLSALGARA